jgi:hypothetical protein
MVSDEKAHGEHVKAWIEQAAKGLSSEQSLQLFERAMGALWERAHQSLGDVTLMAIVDRVLYNAGERFPALGALQVNAGGVDFGKLRENLTGVPESELTEAMLYVLIEYLTVIGNLTADILTPALYSQLSKVTLKDSQEGKV